MQTLGLRAGADAMSVPLDAASTSPQMRAAHLLARLEHVPFSPWHRRARIVMGAATFLDAFDALSLAFALPILVKLWHLSPVDIGWLIGASYIGQLIGAIFFSRMAERRGRVPSATIATFIMSIMGVACILAGSLPLLFVFRLIQGVGVGGEMPVAAAYISELSRAQGRGRFFILYELLFPIGLMATGQVAAFLVPAFGWQTLFLFGALPGLLVTVLLWRLPESPRWLVGKGRYDEAEAIIGQAEAIAQRRFADFTPLRLEDALPALSVRSVSVIHDRVPWRELLSPRYRARTLITWVLWSTAFFVANGLNNWMPTLYHTVYEMPLQQALRAASLTNVAQVAILLGCAFCIDRIGRRNWAVTFYLIGAVLLTGLAVSGAGNVVAVIVCATLAYGAVASNNAVLYLYTPEIYPTRMRAIGTGLATSWLRIASAAGPTLVGMIVTQGGVHWVFAMFAGVSIVGALAALAMIQTQGRQLEEIAT